MKRANFTQIAKILEFTMVIFLASARLVLSFYHQSILAHSFQAFKQAF